MAEVLLAPDVKSSRVKVVAGEVTLDGSNPTPVSVAGKMSTIVAVVLTIKNASAPGVGTSVLTYDVSGLTVNINAWKPTSSADTTLIASTGTEVVSYQIVGF